MIITIGNSHQIRRAGHPEDSRLIQGVSSVPGLAQHFLVSTSAPVRWGLFPPLEVRKHRLSGEGTYPKVPVSKGRDGIRPLGSSSDCAD